MYLPFEQMPSESRIWVYNSERKFTQNELGFIHTKLKNFCEAWNTHGNYMPTSYDIRFEQVIILAVDESQLGASGCSIDSSVRLLKQIEQELGIDLVNQGKVSYFQKDDKLQVSPLLGIKSKIQEGVLDRDTRVINPIVHIKADMDDKWLISAKESWLSKYFANY